MLVASAGGHLDELMIMVDMLAVPTEDAVWVTSRNAQTESVLADREVVWLPRIGSGQYGLAARAIPAAIGLHRRLRPDLLVSTGALFAAPSLFAARVMRTETWFVESATRILGPSATGRFAQRAAGARLFMQRPGWDDPRWTVVPSVFDAFEGIERTPGELRPPTKVVVSLGSEVWPFVRAIESVRRLLPDAEIVWQTGTTRYDVDGEPLRQWVPAAELRHAMASADLIVTHAGVGSVLASLECGKVPVVLPRLNARGEHVDDHQREFADMVSGRGLAVSVDPDELSLDDLIAATSRSVRKREIFD